MDKRKQWDMSDLYYYTKEGRMISPERAISSAVAAATASRKTPVLKYRLPLAEESDQRLNEKDSTDSTDATISDEIERINDQGDGAGYIEVAFKKQFSFNQKPKNPPNKIINQKEKKKVKTKKLSAKKKRSKKEKEEKPMKNKQKEIRDNKKKVKKSR